jgi:Na+/proline symporter
VLSQFALFLFIGVELACFNSTGGGIGGDVSGDRAFMTYVVHHMGVGLKGLILAAVLSAAMSTVASSLNASASSLMSDWIMPLAPTLDDRKLLRLSRLLTIGFAIVQCGVAIGAYEISLQTAIVDAVLIIAGFAIGLLLGLYGLGLIAPRTSEKVALIAFAVGAVVTLTVKFATPLNGYWYTLVGSSTIVVVGCVLGAVLDRRTAPANSQ